MTDVVTDVPATESSVWTHGRESGPQVVVLGVAVALTVVVLDLALVGELSQFFDLWFIVLCLGLAVLVRPDGFFTVGVLPPLMMAAVFALVGAVSPEAVAHADDSVIQAVVSGLATHSSALVAGYVLCLGTLLLRQRSRRG
ncbi:DUF6542 domain-containing protein [Nocardioides sp.]|uniref:DUF6542 domain-containing protein n=1 Tax=Nocardioides sp. TaxID=35761 RepID=UPI0035272537